MLVPRYYQTEACDATFTYLAEKEGNPLVVLPTATGKSAVIAMLILEALKIFPSARITVATHVKELVEQNFLEFFNFQTGVSAGIYSAGLKKRELHKQVTFCGIQSIYKKAFDLGQVDLLIVDEAHTIPHKGEGMWRTFINQLLIPNPKMRVIGLSATPYRLDSGSLIEGEGKIFDEIVYDYPLTQAVKDGFICQPIPKNMTTRYEISKIGKRGGEFIPGEADKIFDIDEKTVSAINEIEEYGKDRNCWLIFAAGNNHAASIKRELDKRNISAAIVTQETSDTDRDKAVNDIRNFGIKALVNNLIFTTGFNAKPIDLIACFRPTKSAGLWTQICGRGFRLHETKKDCLILDFGRNSDRHGPLDLIRCKTPGSGDGDAPIKNCPKCKCVCYAGCSECPDCGFVFPIKEKEDMTARASAAPILSTQVKKDPSIWQKVITTQYSRHKGKSGKKDTMKVKYTCFTGDFYQFCCPEHVGFAREKFCAWFKMRVKDTPPPRTIDEALKFNYPQVSEILTQKNGKYHEVLAVKFAQGQPTEEIILPPEENNILAECDWIPF